MKRLAGLKSEMCDGIDLETLKGLGHVEPVRVGWLTR